MSAVEGAEILQAPVGEQFDIPSRAERLAAVLEQLRDAPAANNGLEAYAQFTNAMNAAEDAVWGPETWDFPRTFLDGRRTDRLYTILPESFHSVEGYPGVTIMISICEIVFVSRWGALQMQRKDLDDKFGQRVPFAQRHDRVLFDKPDAYGEGVWAGKNRT